MSWKSLQESSDCVLPISYSFGNFTCQLVAIQNSRSWNRIIHSKSEVGRSGILCFSFILIKLILIKLIKL